MGGAGCALADGQDAEPLNPANLSNIKALRIAGSIGQLYNLPQVQYQTVGWACPLAWGGLGGNYAYAGTHNYYTEQQAAVAWATPRLWSHGALGVAVRYTTLSITPQYGADWCLVADAGLLFALSDKITCGGLVRNWTAAHWGVVPEPLPYYLTAGLAIHPGERLIIALDVCREQAYPAQLRIGQEIILLQTVVIRTGLQTQPARFTAGCGLTCKNVRFDYGFISHYALGPTHQVGITIWK
jgi:hypothetical protein